MDEWKAEDFQASPVDCAIRLLGAKFSWHGCSGRIVETEAYSERDDPACHTFFRPSTRQFVAEHPPGTAYVYLNYGVHWLFNILVKSHREAGFVLLRALEPIGGIDVMIQRRRRSRLRDLASGPGKLTQALGINGSSHGNPFLGRPRQGLHAGGAGPVLRGPRIGISRGQDLPWRFGLESEHLSQRFPS